MQSLTRPTGTSLYMPSDAFGSSALDTGKPVRDIWSFGVLICEVLVPDFLLNIVRKYPEGVDEITRNGQFAQEVVESMRTVSCDAGLGELAVLCLSLDPAERPQIADISAKLANRNVQC